VGAVNVAPNMRAPERFTAQHDTSQFRNGKHQVLDEWLQKRALASDGLSSRTFVVCPQDTPERVVGYYALSATKEQRGALPSAKLRQGMPDEVPFLLIGRLAVDAAYQGRGLGAALLRDALARCLVSSETIGARAVVTHAIDDEAAAFYRRYGFLLSPLGDRLMLLPLEKVRQVIGG
jgi:GNAT superfamily N-acetyltransferase